MAQAFAHNMNSVHRSGYGPHGSKARHVTHELRSTWLHNDVVGKACLDTTVEVGEVMYHMVHHVGPDLYFRSSGVCALLNRGKKHPIYGTRQKAQKSGVYVNLSTVRGEQHVALGIRH